MEISQKLNNRYEANEMSQEDFEKFLKDCHETNECIYNNLQSASKLIIYTTYIALIEYYAIFVYLFQQSIPET